MSAHLHFGRINEEQNRDSDGCWPVSSRSMAFLGELCSCRPPSVSVSPPGEKGYYTHDNRDIFSSESSRGALHSYTSSIVLLLEDRVQLMKFLHLGQKTPELVDKICDIYLIVYYYLSHCWLWTFASNEVKCDIFYMLFELGLKKYLIGDMTPLFLDKTSRTRTRQFRNTVQAALDMIQSKQLYGHLQDQLLAHSILKFRIALEGMRPQKTLDSPQAIGSAISHYLFYVLLKRVYLFQGVSNRILLQLVTEMKSEYFPPKGNVIMQNEIYSDLYILVTGAVDLLVSKDGIERVVGEAKTGDPCGDVGVLCNYSQFFTVRTRRFSQFLRLSYRTFLKILQDYVEDRSIIVKNFLQHLKELNDPMFKSVLWEMEVLIARDKELPNCYYETLGIDPDIRIDDDGRTAMHVVSSRGKDKHVLTLLNLGANPDIRDVYGSVPLWEAMLAGHESICKMLVRRGAKLHSGDVGQFACVATEKNNLNLLKDIMRYGGDVTLPNTMNGTTALHVAVSQSNLDIVKFLVNLGADIDKPDMDGLTPRALAHQQGNVDIKVFCGITWEPLNAQSLPSTPEKTLSFPDTPEKARSLPPTLEKAQYLPLTHQKQSETKYITRSRSKYMILLIMLLLICIIIFSVFL